MKSNAIATTYDLVIGNRRIRKATRVTFPNGRVVEFAEIMPKGEAIRQAENILYRDYVDHWGKCYSDVEPRSREHYVASLMKEAA